MLIIRYWERYLLFLKALRPVLCRFEWRPFITVTIVWQANKCIVLAVYCVCFAVFAFKRRKGPWLILSCLSHNTTIASSFGFYFFFFSRSNSKERLAVQFVDTLTFTQAHNRSHGTHRFERLYLDSFAQACIGSHIQIKIRNYTLSISYTGLQPFIVNDGYSRL